MLPFKIQSQDPFASVTLAEAKEQCRLTSSFTMDDDYINGLILAAADCAQEYLHWMVSPGVVKQFAEEAGEILLYGKFIDTITTVTAKNAQNEDVTLTADDYIYNDVTEAITIDDKYSDIFITYSCGADTDDLPHNVKQGILMLIATMYNNREDFVTGMSVEKMPMSSYKLLKKSRTYVS